MSPHYIFGQGSKNDNTSIDLATKKGQFICNSRQPERAPESLQAAFEIAKKSCPNGSLRSLSATYNCVGMVFASRRTAIDIEHIGMILKDDEFYKLTDEASVEIGDLVLYISDNTYTHVGIVINKERDILNGRHKFTILSQWGSDGEYIHPINEVPDLYGTTWEFWSEIKRC